MVTQNHEELFLEKEILSPYTYFSQINGKRRYTKLISTFNHWLKVPVEKITPMWDILNILYNTISMCDDVQDGTRFRGVMPSAHSIYGAPLTINASTHALLLVLDKSSDLSPEAGKVILKGYLEMVRGQGIEIYWRDNHKCPKEEEYREMSKLKSSGFFNILYGLLQLFSENKTDYTKLIHILGAYVQIHDDYCNVNYQEGLEIWPVGEDKKVFDETRFCEDITEGKFGFPFIHAMQTEYAEQIMNILRQRTSDINLKKYCVTLLKKAGSFEYTREALAQLDREARAEVARLGGNPELEAVLDDFVTWKK